ncbi:hypothetical protein [Arenivirga flava]|uniref:Elongation factor 4 n=1 Tax=Arenivirga flava TaxID=1930060 RepID=A0AA37UBU8_9MICO|nr:hypothetical protein [Arenivirga flava]GMA27714.1 hypothetical protein GCM10025874_09670 [Arenivirga flava]
MVFSGIYPTGESDVATLRSALERLTLNDAALRFEAEVSAALGAGFRCGFLGLLHMEVVQERLRREYEVEVVATAPTVPYRVRLQNGTPVIVDNPVLMPPRHRLLELEELYVTATIQAPQQHLGVLMELCQRRRGDFLDLAIDEQRARLVSAMPLAETTVEFFSELKALTAGYATVDFELEGYRPSDLVKVEILVDTSPVDAFAFIAHRSAAFERSKQLITELKHGLPRQLYPIPLQAVVEGKVIGRADLPPIRKSALGKGFEGSVSAKKRLAERQRASRSRSQGSALTREDIPHEVFRSILGI